MTAYLARFGKSGIAWHGAMFAHRFMPDDYGESDIDPDEYIIEYFDDLSDDSVDGSFAVFSCLQADLMTFGCLNPSIAEAHNVTDGAATCYGKYMAHVLPLLTPLTCIRILGHSIGEAGMNKSSLDGDFVTTAGMCSLPHRSMCLYS